MAVSSTTGGLKTGVCLSTDRPDNPYTGQVIFESDTGKVYVWAGSAWVNIGDTSGEGVQLPSGTTAERPVSPTAGQMRFNTTTGEPEWYSSAKGAWFRFKEDFDFSLAYLVIAGGGGSEPTDIGGGGGAGGFLEGATTFSEGSSYTVTVGAGGSSASNGVNSVFDSVTSIGGGVGGERVGNVNGTSGGSGGGGGGALSGTPSGGAGTSGQGNAGGTGLGRGDASARGGGGGGAGAAGASGATTGEGGVGKTTTIITTSLATSLSVGEVSGSDVYFAGGGGADGYHTAKSGGLGGGGTGTDGSTNTGGGGAGTGKSGGSGVVILRYPSYWNPTVSAGLTSTTTTVGSDKVTVFTAGTGTVSWA